MLAMAADLPGAGWWPIFIYVLARDSKGYLLMGEIREKPLMYALGPRLIIINWGRKGGEGRVPAIQKKQVCGC